MTLGLAAGTAILLLREPIYRSVVTFELSPHFQQNAAVEDLLEVLQSKKLAEIAAKRMNLSWQVVEQPPGLDLNVGRFNVTGTTSGLMLHFDDGEHYRVFDLSGRLLGHGKSGQVFETEGVELQVDIFMAEPGQKLILENQPINAIADELRSLIEPEAVGQGGRIFKVFTYGDNPGFVRNLANVVVEALQEYFQSTNLRSLSVIEEQLVEARRFHVDLAQKVRQAGLVSTINQSDDAVQELAAEIVGIKQDRERAAALLQRIETSIQQLERSINSESPFLPKELRELPSVTAVSLRLAELEDLKQNLLIDYTSLHPDVIELQDQIDQVKEQLLFRYQLAGRDLASEIDSKNELLATRQQSLESAASQTDSPLLHRWQDSEQQLETLAKRRREAQLAVDNSINLVRVLDPAVTPGQKYAPQTGKTLFTSTLIGLLLGVFFSFLLSLFDRRFNRIEEVQSRLGLPVYGVIPKIPVQNLQKSLPVAVQMPKAPVVEAFRALRTRLHAVTQSNTHQVILVTSSFPGEGKSTISANLAVVLGLTGARVLLVGCDLRRPSLHEMFGQTNEPGLAELLVGKKQGAIRQLVNPRVDFLPSGAIPDNPAELLESGRWRRLIETLRGHYDYVVLDAPPVLPVTDAQILAPLADMILAVLEPCRVPEKAAVQMVDALRAVGVVIDGIIINDRTGRGFRYYSSFSYYGNKNYGGYYGESLEAQSDGVVVSGVKRIWEKFDG